MSEWNVTPTMKSQVTQEYISAAFSEAYTRRFRLQAPLWLRSQIVTVGEWIGPTED